MKVKINQTGAVKWHHLADVMYSKIYVTRYKTVGYDKWQVVVKE